MFGLFKRKPPADPPTQRQLNYAKRLGIAVNPRMSKPDLSAAIAAAERRKVMTRLSYPFQSVSNAFSIWSHIF